MARPVPIQIARIERVGLHHRYARLMVIHVKLEPLPSPRWRSLFEGTGALQGRAASVPDNVQEDVLILTVPEEEIDAALAEVRERIKIANAHVEADLISSEFSIT